MHLVRASPWTLSRTDRVLGHKASPNTCETTETTARISSNHDSVKLEGNDKRKN